MTTPYFGAATAVRGGFCEPIETLHWFALRVRSKFESTAKNILQGKNVETFFPSYQSRSYRSDRVKMVDRPLFPGYIFCRLDSQNWLPVLKTPGVLQVVSFGGTPAQVDNSEIQALRLLAQSSVDLFPRVFLQVGQRVSIDSGPLAGLEGILERFDKKCRIVVSISLLQRSVSAQLDAEWVTVIN